MGRRFYDTTLIMAGKICPYCGQPTEYVDSAAVYHGISYGMIYLCRKCDAYVGVHRGTDKALGRLANRSLREWKKRAHYYFDPISRTPLINRIWPKYIPGISNRNKAYRWLAAQMGVEPEVSLPPSQSKRRGSVSQMAMQSDEYRAGAGFRLNPRFVAEMMGFPVDWTALPFQVGAGNPSKPTATP